MILLIQSVGGIFSIWPGKKHKSNIRFNNLKLFKVKTQSLTLLFYSSASRTIDHLVGMGCFLYRMLKVQYYKPVTKWFRRMACNSFKTLTCFKCVSHLPISIRAWQRCCLIAQQASRATHLASTFNHKM